MVMAVYWLEQTGASIPTEDDWLSDGEITVQGKQRFAKRRADWRLGRWTAKRALSACLDLPLVPRALREIEVRAAASGAPEAYLFNQPADVTISLSHSFGRAVCAVAFGRVALGCDLEAIEPRSAAFVAGYFDAGEQACIARAHAGSRPCLTTLIWSAKESALKALGAGLRRDTRSVIVGPLEEIRSGVQELPADAGAQGRNDWESLYIRCIGDADLQGWWMSSSGWVRTVAAAPPPRVPIMLEESPGHEFVQRLR
jgi:4'-phosphopantetheinyl transferase